MNNRILTILGLIVIAGAMVVEWKLAAATGAADAKHQYHGVLNGQVGQPYQDLIRALRTMAEAGDTNRLIGVLRRADARSRDIYDVWLHDSRGVYRSSVVEILK